jgi:protein TonB
LYVDTIPKFKGGAGYLNRFIRQNLKWPDNTEDVQGTVLVSFVVLSDGNIANVKIEKPLFPAFDAEAIRLVKSMPKWVPGKVGNKVVDIKMYFPVDFNVINE